MIITLSRCTLRPWRPGDEAGLARHANDREVWRNLRDAFPHPYTIHDAREWVRHVDVQAPVTEFAIVVGGEAAGGIGFIVQSDIFRRSAEVGFWIGREHWGRGIVTEALVAVTDYAFASFDLVRMYAGVIDWNLAYSRVLEKAGYALEGRLRRAVTKDGSVADELLYGKVAEDR